MVGWSRPAAPGTCCWRIASIAAGDRVGVAERGEERLLPLARAPPRRRGWPRWPGRRDGSAPGSAWRGHRPCSPRSGTARRTPRGPRRPCPRTQPGRHQPADVEHLGLLDRVVELPPDLGHVEVAGRQPGVGRDHPGEPVGVLGDQPQPDQPAPVLADQRHVAAGRGGRRPARGPTRRAARRCGRPAPAACRSGRSRPGRAPRSGPRRRPAPRSRAGRGTTTTARRAAAGRPARRRDPRRRTPSGACRRPGPPPRRTTAARGSRAGRRSGPRGCGRSPRGQSGGPRMVGTMDKPRIFLGSSGKQARLLKSLTGGLADRRRGRAVDDRLQPRRQHPGPAGRAHPRGRLRGVRLRAGRLDLATPGDPAHAGARHGRTARQRGLRGGPVRRRARHAQDVHPARERREAADRPARPDQRALRPGTDPAGAQVGQPEGPQGDRGRGPARRDRGRLVAVLPHRAQRVRALGGEPAPDLPRPAGGLEVEGRSWQQDGTLSARYWSEATRERADPAGRLLLPPGRAAAARGRARGSRAPARSRSSRSTAPAATTRSASTTRSRRVRTSGVYLRADAGDWAVLDSGSVAERAGSPSG